MEEMDDIKINKKRKMILSDSEEDEPSNKKTTTAENIFKEKGKEKEKDEKEKKKQGGSEMAEQILGQERADNVPRDADTCFSVDMALFKSTLKSYVKILENWVFRINPKEKLMTTQGLNPGGSFVRCVIKLQSAYTCDGQERDFKVKSADIYSLVEGEDSTASLRMYCSKDKPERLLGQTFLSNITTAAFSQFEFSVHQIEMLPEDVEVFENTIDIDPDQIIEFDLPDLSKKVIRMAPKLKAENIGIEICTGVSPQTQYYHTMVKFFVSTGVNDGVIVTYTNKTDKSVTDKNVIYDHIFSTDDPRVVRMTSASHRINDPIDQKLMKCIFKHNFVIKDLAEFLNNLSEKNVIIRFKENHPIIIHSQYPDRCSFTSFGIAPQVDL